MPSGPNYFFLARHVEREIIRQGMEQVDRTQTAERYTAGGRKYLPNRGPACH